MITNMIKLSDDIRTANVYYINGQYKVEYISEEQLIKKDYFLTQYGAVESARNFAFNFYKENP